MRVAVAQILSGADPEQNLAEVRTVVADAAARGARLVAFPEATMRAFGAGRLDEIAQELDGPWARGVADAAREHGVVVAVGMFRPGGPGVGAPARVTNTLLVTDGGDLHVGYDKIHLFDAFGFAESDTVVPGGQVVSVEVDGVRVGLTLCYDVRFPEQYRRLAADGADLILCCASWGSGAGKLDQWRVLTRARALDCTSFVVACGQADPAVEGAGSAGNAPTGIGHSAVVAPDGTVVAEAGAARELLFVEIDTSLVADVRAAIPVLANGRVTERGSGDE